MASNPPLLSALCRAAVACAGLASFFALSSCAADEPEIAEIQARRLLIQDEAGGFSPCLSVFALFSGGDTADDFAMMTVTHEETGIFWEVPASAAFLFAGENGFYWAGSSFLLPVPDLFAGEARGFAAWEAEGFFPEGSYSVSADNAAGSSAFSSFALDAPFYFSEQPAALRISGEGREARWSIALSESLNPSEISVYLFLLDADGNPLSSIRIAQMRFMGRRAEGQISDFAEVLALRRGDDADFSDVRAVSCYTEHAPSSSGVLLFPLSLGQEVE